MNFPAEIVFCKIYLSYWVLVTVYSMVTSWSCKFFTRRVIKIETARRDCPITPSPRFQLSSIDFPQSSTRCSCPITSKDRRRYTATLHPRFVSISFIVSIPFFPRRLLGILEARASVTRAWLDRNCINPRKYTTHAFAWKRRETGLRLRINWQISVLLWKIINLHEDWISSATIASYRRISNRRTVEKYFYQLPRFSVCAPLKKRLSTVYAVIFPDYAFLNWERSRWLAASMRLFPLQPPHFYLLWDMNGKITSATFPSLLWKFASVSSSFRISKVHGAVPHEGFIPEICPTFETNFQPIYETRPNCVKDIKYGIFRGGLKNYCRWGVRVGSNSVT